MTVREYPQEWRGALGDWNLVHEYVTAGPHYDKGGAVFNVKHPDFGAVGDGVTDDTTAINNAIAAAATSGGTVFFPHGEYHCTSRITISTSGIELVGEGRIGVRQTRLVFDGVSGFLLTNVSGHVNIRRLRIDSTGVSGATRGIEWNVMPQVVLEDVLVSGFSRAFHIAGSGSFNLHFLRVDASAIDEVFFFDPTGGVPLSVWWYDCSFTNTSTIALGTSQVVNLFATNCFFELATVLGLRFAFCNGVRFLGCEFNEVANALDFQGATSHSCAVIGCTFRSTTNGGDQIIVRVPRSIVKGNIVRDLTGAFSDGIVIRDVANVEVEGNQVRNCGEYGILLLNATDCTVRGNTVLACASNGINEQGTSLRNLITDNVVTGNGGTQIVSSAAGTTRARNRISTGALQGQATLVNGTVTINTTEVLAGDNIRLTRIVGAGTTRGMLTVGTIVAGTSFVIRAEDLAGALSADDDSTIFWEIVH